MAILGAFSIARSGLISDNTALSAIGNNIANVNTIGYKGSRAEFADLLATQPGGGQAGEIGLGTSINDVRTIFTQGSIESTGQPTDLAIDGNGFFIVRSGQGDVYTRAGNFKLDANGTLVTTDGLPVEGFALDANNQPIGAPVDIQVTGGSSPAIPTGNIKLQSNLDANATIISGGFDGTDFNTAQSTSNFTVPLTVYDSLGASHSVNIYFTKTAANTWDWNAGVDAGDTGGTAGALALIGNGSLTFNPDGSLNATSPDPGQISVTFNGANAQTINLNFGTPNPTPTAGLGLDGVTQFAGSSSVSATQDGFAAGRLQSLAIDDHGFVNAVFDNGQTRPLFQLALTTFPSPEGLEPLGNQLYRATADSGSPSVSTPQTNGLGKVVAGALEQSNVDLAQQFIDLISTQRGFQANARVITTGDTMLTDLLNIIR
jgi:flagellar hook protein FlgE